MRITLETLLKIAKDTANDRARSDRSLLAIYLQGSLLGGQPLLGNSADIDLYLVHNDAVAIEREIIRLTDEVHLDIAHHASALYRQPRKLRLHAWLGPNLYGCKILYDPQHFLDFSQASVRGQFFHPDNVLGRVRPLVEHARQIWTAFHETESVLGAEDVLRYLRALEHAANAVAGLAVFDRLTLDAPATALTLVASATGVASATSAEFAVTNPPARLKLASGDRQQGKPGAALPSPLVVLVEDSRGNPLSNVSVQWLVASGGGSIAALSTTNALGLASALWTLGGTNGAQSATASVDGARGSPVQFSATAKP